MSVFIIAEIGSVHDGSFGNAKKLIELAKACGADAVKFQTHIAEAETLKDAPNPPYFQDESRYDYFVRTGFSLEQWNALKVHADKIGIEFMSSPFSIEAVELLERVGMKRYKIPSGEVTNTPLLEAVVATGKSVFLSSGMSSWKELDRAVEVLRGGHADVTILQCTSEYPCPPERVGLNVIDEMRARYDLPVGFSDHTLTHEAAFIAVSKGISILEKHLTFSRAMYGSDAKHSLEPSEFKELVRGVRSIETMMRSPVDMHDVSRYEDMKQTFQKSIVSVADIPKGTVITRAMLGFKKPGTGIPGHCLAEIVGRKAAKNISKDAILKMEDLA